MLNFLFGVMCAGGAVFGSLLTYTGVSNQNYDAVIAGGVFLFGSLLTFGIGQITRSIRARQKQAGRSRDTRRSIPRGEPVAFLDEIRPEPVIPHPVLERVASRFARPHR